MLSWSGNHKGLPPDCIVRMCGWNRQCYFHDDQNVDQVESAAGPIVYTVTAPDPQYAPESANPWCLPGNSGGTSPHPGRSKSGNIIFPNSDLERERSKWRELWTFRTGKAYR